MATIPPIEVRIDQMEPVLRFTPQGLTLREFAAVAFLHAVVSRTPWTTPQGTARRAVEAADALVAALNSEAPNAQ